MLATLEFLYLENAWKDDRNAEDIITEIKAGRNNSNRFERKNGLFD